MNPSLQAAIAKVGTQAALAAKIGVTQGAVSSWLSGRKPIPVERCPLIETATDGAVTCEQLLPDVPWCRIDGRPLIDVVELAQRRSIAA